MLLRKLLLFALASCFVPIGAIAQVTDTPSTSYPIASYEATPKVVRATNIWGGALKSVFFNGNPDTTQAIVIKGTVVDSFYSGGYYHAIVDLQVYLPDDSTLSYSAYRDTLTHGVELILPATSHALIRDSVLHVTLNATTGVSPADRFEASILSVGWDNLIPKHRVVWHPLSRLTIIPAWSDTLADNADTTYSDAVWGGWRWMTWAFNGICSSGVDDFGDSWFGWGIQNKFGDDWSMIHVVDDSFYIAQDVLKDTTVVHNVADSTRAALWGNTTTTNLYLEFLKWIGRN